jgi:(2Fe-2S) ferredoxin
VERVGCLGQCDRSPTIVSGGQLYYKVRPRDLPLIFQKALGAKKVDDTPDGAGNKPDVETA